MAVGLLIAAAVAVTTSRLICGLIKLKESERERIIKLFERETDDKRTFEELRGIGYTGSTHRYLRKNFSIVNLSTTAALEVVLDLVKLDLAEGAKPEEIVFECCWWWPERDAINAVIAKTGAKIENILEYENKKGLNCLMTMFDALVTL